MLQLKCPNCGADITLDDTREFGFCSYCGTKVLLDEYKKRVDGVPGVANLLLRADDFLKQGNVEKAREYYNRVLDIDINNNEANSRLNSIKQREKIQQAESEKLFSDSDYRRAKEIFNFINSQYETKNNILRVFYVVSLGIIVIFILLFHVVKRMLANIHQLILDIPEKLDY